MILYDSMNFVVISCTRHYVIAKTATKPYKIQFSIRSFAMADDEDCVSSFKSGDKQPAENLLARVRKGIKTTFEFSYSVVAMVSLLHLASYWGWGNIVAALVTVYSYTADVKDGEGHLPLHYAAYNGHLDVVRYLVVELLCDPMSKNYDGETPLHCACRNGQLDVTKYLILELCCDPSCESKYGNTLLHEACIHDHLEIVCFLICEAKCNPSCKNSFGTTPLHYACNNGHLNIIRYLVSEAHCDPSLGNTICDTPLHIACSLGYLPIVQYLISEAGCNTACKNNEGWTPLHFACSNGHLNITQYLINETQCNPSSRNNIGNTPLHEACVHNHAHIVQYLLSTGRVNPLAKNVNGETPLHCTSGHYDIIKLFHPFEQCRIAFPVHTFSKLILIGDSGAGKTTMTELIILMASSQNRIFVANTKRFTAGILPHHIESELGNYVVYDFAGQQEYYSSHVAVLEQVMHRSAAIFLCMIDLSKGKEEVCQSLQYWLSFVDNASNTAEGTSHVVIVGSHADQVLPLEMDEKSSMLQVIATRRIKRQEYAGYIGMDCRHADTDAADHLISLLKRSQKVIAASQPIVSFYCHVLYAFLRTELKVVGSTLMDLISLITNEENSSLPNDPKVLTELLTLLSDRGLILFIQNDQSSWVVVKTEILLNEINGTIFAPRDFKEYQNFASNTGIVPVSNLLKAFPQYNSEMLIGFLESLDFCSPVEPSLMHHTNLEAAVDLSSELLFFPGLVRSERPHILTGHRMLEFGWCLGCQDPHKFFGSRFLQILLLSIAYRFPLNARRRHAPSLEGLQRRCVVWKNGISWTDSDEITAVVELISKNRCVLVAMSCDQNRPIEHARLRSALITLVRSLHKDRCPNLEVYECLISPSFVKQYPFDDIPDTDLFDIQDVAESLLLQKPSILSQNESCIGHLSTQSLPLEPYYLLSPSSVCELFNRSMADQPIPVTILQDLKKLIGLTRTKLQNYEELKKYLDHLSLFGGRSPLVSHEGLNCVCKLLMHTGSSWIERGRRFK